MVHERKDYLMGDPDLPVLKDDKKAKELLSKITSPSHEPIQFLRRRGTASQKNEDDYVNMHTEENINYMFELGIRMPKRFHFYKGMGIEHERPEIDKTIEVAKYMHKKGMKISVYIGGTFFSDSAFQEIPEARDWLRIDQNNDPVTYGGYQLWRYFPCLNNPHFIEFNKKLLDIAVEEVEADEIFYDNQILRYEPRSCRCEYCIQHHRDYVRKNYSLDEVEHRYGFREYPEVDPPTWSMANKPWRLEGINPPDIQDWVNHRITTVFEFYKTMKDHVYAKREGVAVGMNIKGVHCHNRGFDHGIDHNVWADELDFTCLDSGQAHPRMERGALVSEIRAFKMSQSLKVPVTCGDGGPLGTCTHQVYTYRKFIKGHGYAGGMDRHMGYNPVTQWFRENQKMFLDRGHIYDAAVLRNSASCNYNCTYVHDSLYPFEQTLLTKKVPFTLIYDYNIDKLDPYKVICLVEQESLSDEWLQQLADFCRAGGGIVATGTTGAYNGWRRPRNPVHGLEQFFDFVPGDKVVKKELEKGRFAYIPKLDRPFEFKLSAHDWPWMGADKILPLNNSDEIVELVKWAAGDELTAEVTGCDTVVAELIEADNDGLSLHLINFQKDNKDTELKVTIPGMAGRSGLLCGPGMDDVEIKDCGTFSVPVPEIYSVIIVDQ